MSTLYVDNLQPNLGSQVEIPDLKPLVGQVVNTQTVVATSDVLVTSNTAFSDALTMAYTPKKAGNLLRIVHSGVHDFGGASGVGCVAQMLLNGSRIEGTGQSFDLIYYWSGVSGTANHYQTVHYVKHATAVSGTNTIQFQIRKYSTSGNNIRMNTTWGTNRLTVMEIAQ